MATYILTVEKGDPTYPFRHPTLDAAIAAYERLDDEFKPFAWITCRTQALGKDPVDTVYMKDGKLIRE